MSGGDGRSRARAAAAVALLVVAAAGAFLLARGAGPGLGTGDPPAEGTAGGGAPDDGGRLAAAAPDAASGDGRADVVVVAGRVTTSDGAPAAGAHARVVDFPRRDEVARCEADAAGRFTFEGVRGALYQVHVAPADDPRDETLAPAEVVAGAGELVATLRSPDASRPAPRPPDATAAAPARPPLLVRVQDARGNPVPAAAVSRGVRRGADGEYHLGLPLATTDRQGRAQMPRRGDGTERLSVQPRALGSPSVEVEVGERDAEVTVTVEATVETSLTVTGSGGRREGMVHVIAFGADGASATTTMPILWGRPVPVPVGASVVRLAALVVAEAWAAWVPDAHPGTPLEVVLEPAGEVRGRVVEEAGGPAGTTLSVVALLRGTEVFVGRAEVVDGAFVLGGVPRGAPLDVVVTRQRPDPRGFTAHDEVGRVPAEAGASVTVPVAAPVADR